MNYTPPQVLNFWLCSYFQESNLELLARSSSSFSTSYVARNRVVSLILFTCSEAKNSWVLRIAVICAPWKNCAVALLAADRAHHPDHRSVGRTCRKISGVISSSLTTGSAAHSYLAGDYVNTTLLKLSGPSWWFVIVLTEKVATFYGTKRTILSLPELQKSFAANEAHYPVQKPNSKTLHRLAFFLYSTSAPTMPMIQGIVSEEHWNYMYYTSGAWTRHWVWFFLWSWKWMIEYLKSCS